jgi:hypothetical protein
VAHSKTDVVFNYSALLAARGYTTHHIAVLLQIANHENKDGTPCFASNGSLAMELNILDEKTIRAAVKRARNDGFLGERRSASIWGTTERWIIIEKFTAHEEELGAIKAEFKRRRHAGPPTEEEIEAWDEIGYRLCWDGQHRGVFTQEQVKRMKTFLFTHLGMSLRFDPRAPGEWTIVRRNAPAMEHDPRWQKIVADIVQSAFADRDGWDGLREVRPWLVEGAKALFSWHWPGHHLNFGTQADGEWVTLSFDMPTTPPRVREGLLTAETENVAPAPEPVPPPPPVSPAAAPPSEPKHLAEDDPSQDIPF